MSNEIFKIMFPALMFIHGNKSRIYTLL